MDTRNPAGGRGGPALVAGAPPRVPGRRRLRHSGLGLGGLAERDASPSRRRRATCGSTPAARRCPRRPALNFAAGATRANNAVAALGSAGDLTVYAGQPSGTVHLILDVNGYFE